MEIKSCRIENNVCSVGRFTGISWPDLHKQLKNKGLSHHLWGLANTKKFATVSHSPSRFGVKEAWILICNKIVPWDTTRVQSLGREDLLEKEMATHSSILAWKILWMEKPGRLQSMRLQRVGHDWATSFSFTFWNKTTWFQILALLITIWVTLVKWTYW